MNGLFWLLFWPRKRVTATLPRQLGSIKDVRCTAVQIRFRCAKVCRQTRRKPLHAGAEHPPPKKILDGDKP